MEKDIKAQTIAPAPKTVRGYLSSLDVNDHHILYFNGGTVILLPQDPTKPVLNVVHLNDVAAVKFSPDGRLAASLDVKGVLIISEICPDKLLFVRQFENFFPNAKSIDWSADGKRICAVGEGKTTFGRVGLVETGTNVGEITAVTSTLNSCSFRPERPYKLVLGGDEMALKFFDGPPYSFKQSDQTHKGFINQVKYSPKGAYILTGGADRKLTLHDGLKY
jgi:WD40 repeat protein